LSALAEAAILVVASLYIAGRAISHLVGASATSVEATWYAFAVIGVVIAIDLSRTVVPYRASRRFGSAALGASALHFGSEVEVVTRIVRETTGRPPRELRFLRTDEGLIAFLTLGIDPGRPLADAHAYASEIEERIRERPDIADVIVRTEP
jgi:divalent metal cation (Fe/Co/Zn/Cd) transporter